jgi:hypothetical protein
MKQTRYPHLGVAAAGISFFALAAVLSTPLLCADEAGQPARAVRLGYVDGRVTLAEGDQTIADPALVNTPLFEGTQMTTASDGSAELQFDDGSVARLSPDGVLSIPQLRPGGQTQLQLDHGLAYFELQGTAAAGSIAVQFGDVTVTTSGTTVFRVRCDTPPGELAVFSGKAHVERPGGLALDLHGGESVRLEAGDSARYTLAESIEPDSWDTWNADRDQALGESAAGRTGAANGFSNSASPAWSDLDSYGNWYNMPGQGYVWTPNEAASPGWDPWGNGHWIWTPRFGYIWVSGDPWGYMPFACGAWDFYDGMGWGWMPGHCNPWWDSGIWVPTYFNGPRGFQPPHRPHPGPPRHRPFLPGGRRVAYPPIAVNRRPVTGPVAGQPRHFHTPVTVSGTVLQPLRPMPQRPPYNHLTGGTTQAPPAWGSYRAPTLGGGSVVRPSGPQSGFNPGNHPGGNRAGYQPQPPSYGGQRGASGSSHTGSSGASHTSSGGGSHAGSGGGGGGGSHASSGGGGGGGGAHSGGGGGGGPHH